MAPKYPGRILLSCFCSIFIPCLAFCLSPVDDSDLSQVTGASGITIAVESVEIFTHFDEFIYKGSDGGYIEFKNFRITDGQNGPMQLNFNSDYAGLINMDVGTVEVASPYTLQDWISSTNPTAGYMGMFGVSALEWDQELAYVIPEFIFSDGTVAGTKSLGSVYIGQVDMPSYQYFMAPNEQGSGVNWAYDFELNISDFQFKYEDDLLNVLNIHNIAMHESFAGDPADTSTWSGSGQFHIGDMFGDLANNEHSNPARFDVGVLDAGGGLYEGAAGLQLPMTGSVRIENVQFGGNDFGQAAIDGINAYRMEIYMIP